MVSAHSPQAQGTIPCLYANATRPALEWTSSFRITTYSTFLHVLSKVLCDPPYGGSNEICYC